MSIKLTEEQIKEAIVRMNNSEEYLALSRYFSRDSFLKILHFYFPSFKLFFLFFLSSLEISLCMRYNIKVSSYLHERRYL